MSDVTITEKDRTVLAQTRDRQAAGRRTWISSSSGPNWVSSSHARRLQRLGLARFELTFSGKDCLLLTAAGFAALDEEDDQIE